MQIFLQVLILIAGFALLVKGADWLVDGAAGIAERAGMSKLVIGLTIVAMGTSSPEAAISISAALKGSADIAVGNVLGSNILNVLLILGLTAVITPLSVHKTTVKYEIPFVFFITVIFALIGFVPIVRYLVLHNHSYLHYFFTYRALMVSVMAMCLIAFEIIDRRYIDNAFFHRRKS